MRRQDGQRTFLRLEDQHQDLGPGGLVLEDRTAPPVVGVPQRRLVAVMAVGEGDGTGAEPLGDSREASVAGVVLAHRAHPEPVAHPGFVHELDNRGARDDLAQPVCDRPRAILSESDHGAGVDIGRAEEPVAVLARLGQRPLVGAYPARRPECLEADAREHTPPGRFAIGPRNHVALLVGIDGRPRIAPQDALRPPRGEGSTRPTVALVLGITGLVLREVQCERRSAGRARGGAGALPGRSRRTAARRPPRGHRPARGSSAARGTGGSTALTGIVR